MKPEGTSSIAWDQDLASEFAANGADQAPAMMTSDPYVHIVPPMIGARGRYVLHDFYANHFLSQIPRGMGMITVSRAIGQDRVVDEIVARVTHSNHLDWLCLAFRQPENRSSSPSSSSRAKATRPRTSTCTGNGPRFSYRLASSIGACPCAAAKSRRRCLSPTQPMNEFVRRTSV
jgi:carboxymethylenebutenolidase